LLGSWNQYNGLLVHQRLYWDYWKQNTNRWCSWNLYIINIITKYNFNGHQFNIKILLFLHKILWIYGTSTSILERNAMENIMQGDIWLLGTSILDKFACLKWFWWWWVFGQFTAISWNMNHYHSISSINGFQSRVITDQILGGDHGRICRLRSVTPNWLCLQVLFPVRQRVVKSSGPCCQLLHWVSWGT